MWTHLEPRSAGLQQVFEPLYISATQYDRIWSIAELKLAKDEIEWLRSWFSRLTLASIRNWTNPIMPTHYNRGSSITYRQMFGSLLICAGAEACREESREDSVWPAIRSILPEDHALRRELFLPNGQPCSSTKEVVAEAVHALNLRHAMDIEGTQQWFVTIKLQFGFTYRGAKNRLAEWLVGLGQPHAVQYLNGDSEFSELASETFKSLWKALTQYRRGLIGEKEAIATLQGNPWIKTHWIDDLLKEAQAKITTLGTGEVADEKVELHEEELSEEEFCPIANIALEWNPNTAPRLRFQLDRQAIENEVAGTDIGELDFYIDGRKLCRWLRQRDGSWTGLDHIYAEPEKCSEQPNLSPRTLIIQSRYGESLLEWDFADSGLWEDVLVFDLEKGRMIKTGFEPLELNRRYAIICDYGCELKGNNAVETFERKGISRKVMRLALPLDDNLSIAYKDFVLWQPVRAKRDQPQRFTVILTTPKGVTLSLGDRSKLFLEGLPKDADSVKLLVHKKTYDLQYVNGIWCTLKDITITPELAARQRRVRVHFWFAGRTYTQKPRLAFSLLGVAMLRYQQNDNAETVPFEVLKQGEELNRSEGTAHLRIWTPEYDKSASVFEGDCLVGRLRYRKIRLRDMPGYGGELQIMDQGKRYSFGVACLDTGCVRAYLPPMLGSSDAQLFFLSDMDPAETGDDGYILYVWSVGKKGKAKLHRLSGTSIQPTSNKRLWKIRGSDDPMAVAVTWKGVWRGAWWSLGRIRDYINERTDLPAHDFAIIKWLRVPILHPTLFSTISKSITHTPGRFMEAWLNDGGLPDELEPHPHIPGIDSVIRQFLWNDFPPGQAKDVISSIMHKYNSTNSIGSYSLLLKKLAQISPILLWKGMEQFLECSRETIIDLLRMFTRAQVGLSADTDSQQVLFKLQSFEGRAASATGISQERVREITNGIFRSMLKKQWHPSEKDRVDLLRLGQTISGRKYLSTQMCQYWLNLA